MGINEYFSNADARLWTQLDGPGSALVHINCVDIGDVDQPQGDVSREMCPDPRVPGRSHVAMRAQGQPGEATIQFTVPLGKTSDYLDTMAARRCQIPFYVLWAACASVDVFLPLDVDEQFRGYTARGGILTGMGKTNQGSALRDGSPASGVMKTYTVSFASLEDFYQLVAEKVALPVGAILAWNDVAAFNAETCGGTCGAPEQACERLIAVGAAAAAAPEIYFSANSGTTWTVAAASPLAVAMSVVSCGGFPTAAGTWRAFVMRGTTDAGVADVCYTDDVGVSWTTVDLPTTTTEFGDGNQSLCIVNRNLIFAVTGNTANTAGTVSRGTSQGTVWEAVLTGDVLNCVDFLNDNEGIACGEANAVWHTIDGGETWDALTGIATGVEIKTCVMLDSMHWIIGYAAAVGTSYIYQTFNAGRTWESIVVNLPVAGATAIIPHSLRRVDDHCLWASFIYTAGAAPWGSIARNVAGGASNAWEHNVTGLTTIAGMAGIQPCGYNKCIGVGGVQAAQPTVMIVAND